VLTTRDPGGTALGDIVRKLLLQEQDGGMDAISELLLFAAARREIVSRYILPALARGQWVLCDRFYDAAYAYQGGGRGVGLDTLRAVEIMVQQDLKPDLTILLDLPAAIRKSRTQLRSTYDRFEAEGVDFFRRVRSAYLDRAASEPNRIHIINAAQPLLAVRKEITKIIENHIIAAPIITATNVANISS
jgi:dTMP kinase